ncbi:type II toxin-antitoxin system PemK/MazF family toxin [Methylobacterium sp. WL19]|uniref:type II toxin-antitoxin system PemK/MazF family toxin n=1 Tax=Methylobacterium sp. WL19 TaxID=2603896 RepID=UPI0011CC8CE8|nr:type II toxin-antitoxin system PemK/MazF family toxin [Methylobacterium sp. WL19]TXN24934.1 type II toxin-antitoxin system PemK/MazF family toxin [Methylobacterium sp. WL19]
MMTIPADRPHEPGDLILVDLDPVLGTEQRGKRPVLIISTLEMNTLTGRIIICPVTRNRDPWPTKVFLPEGLGADGAVLADQVRSIDRRARILRSLGTVPDPILAEVRAKVAALIGLQFDSETEESSAP